MEETKAERREGYVQVTKSFIDRMKLHLDKEDAWERRLTEGAQRMESIENSLASVSSIIKTAEGFIRATRIIAVLVGLLMGAYGWVLLEKNADIKALQLDVRTLAVQNSAQIAITQQIMASQVRDQARFERHIDRTGNGTSER